MEEKSLFVFFKAGLVSETGVSQGNCLKVTCNKDWNLMGQIVKSAFPLVIHTSHPNWFVWLSSGSEAFIVWPNVIQKPNGASMIEEWAYFIEIKI